MNLYNNISQLDLSQWMQLVEGNSTASFFQTPECYNFYASLSFLKPFLYAVSENDKLVGVMCGYVIADGGLVKSFFSKRAIVPGGLLLSEEISDVAIQNLLQSAANGLKGKAIYIEIRNYNNYSAHRKPFEMAGFSYQSHLDILISTPNKEIASKGLHDSKRRQLKTAQKLGVKWTETTQASDIDDFYLCLKNLYKTKVKTPLFPLEFFQKLANLPHGKLLVVKHQDKVIGGMACVILPNNSLYEWFVCGDDSVQKEFYPSVMATWAGIECATQYNIPSFDFMGAGKPDKNYGVREFKSKFGGELLDLGRFQYICKPKLYALGKWMVARLKRV